MKPIARADIYGPETWFDHRLNRRDRRKLVGTLERNLEGTETTHRDAGDERRSTIASDLVRISTVREQSLGNEGLPLRSSIAMIQVIARCAGAVAGQNHRRQKALGPPSIENRFERDQVFAA